ncbi:MAG: SDR family NAD(P)-dependent oxidoreductase, partial [Hyphomicrobiaceae bacterium]
MVAADTSEADALERGGASYVVTGAGSGLNLAIAKRLLSHGCRVSAWDLKIDGLEGITDPNLRFFNLDVRDKQAQIAAAQATADATGGIAGLVAGAGVMTHAPFLELTEEAFDRTLAINLKGAMLTVQSVEPHMRSAGRGSIVMFSSMLARITGSNAADYIASKAGILGFARSIAMELAPEGIRVNTISPA